MSGLPEVRARARRHTLDLPPERFEAIRAGTLSFLLVPDGPGYEAGDVLDIREGVSGEGLAAGVTYVTSAGNPCALSPDGLAPGWCILSLAPGA